MTTIDILVRPDRVEAVADTLMLDATERHRLDRLPEKWRRGRRQLLRPQLRQGAGAGAMTEC
jgi:DNA-binding transcriptional regulator YbjK